MVRRLKYSRDSPVPEASAFDFEMVTEKLKRQKSLGTDQIPAQLIKESSKRIRSEIHNLLILFGIRRNILMSARSRLLYLFIKGLKKTDSSNYRSISILPTTYKILPKILLSRLPSYTRKLLGIISVDFDETGRLLITYSAFVRYLRENRNTTKQCIRYL